MVVSLAGIKCRLATGIFVDAIGIDLGSGYTEIHVLYMYKNPDEPFGFVLYFTICIISSIFKKVNDYNIMLLIHVKICFDLHSESPLSTTVLGRSFILELIYQFDYYLHIGPVSHEFLRNMIDNSQITVGICFVFLGGNHHRLKLQNQNLKEHKYIKFPAHLDTLQ